MRTKTNMQALQDLLKSYKPAKQGIVSDSEQNLIRRHLELETRDELELRDIRDAAVMYCSRQSSSEKNMSRLMGMLDAMSGITAVIDAELSKRGLPV